MKLSPSYSSLDDPEESPSASGRRASTLTPVRPRIDREAHGDAYGDFDAAHDLDGDDRDDGNDGDDGDSDPPYAAYRPEPARGQSRHGLFRRRSAFSLRERDWRTLAWIRRVRVVPAVGALLAILLIVGAFALVLASRAASSAGNRLLGTSISGRSSTQVVVVQAPQTTEPTTTVTSPYQVGVWTSTYAPGTSGTMQVYVRVSQNPLPVPNVPVTVVLQFGASSTPYGPTKTDSDGIAVFNVFYSGATAGQPIYAVATATIAGKSVTGQTTFVVGGGSAPDNSNLPVNRR